MRKNNLSRHDDIGVSVPETHAAGVQQRSFVNKGVESLVLPPSRCQRNNPSTDWNALGGYWMNHKTAVCKLSKRCLRPRRQIQCVSPSDLDFCVNDTNFVETLPDGNASMRSVG